MRVFLLFFCVFFPVSLAFAQHADSEEPLIPADSFDDAEEMEILIIDDIHVIDTSGSFWISSGIETAMYSRTSLCYGGSFTFAYGKGVSVGFKAAYFLNFENRIDVLELGFLLRFYLRGSFASSGPFIQFSGGQALFIRPKDCLTIPAQWGAMYGGADAGWRFILGNTFFIEPFIRGGYPYIAGGGLLVGLVF